MYPHGKITTQKYSLSAIVDGKIRTLVDLDNLYGPGLFNNYEYRYMLINEQTGKDIISALEPFGFAFDQYEGSLVFTNTDSDVESYGKTYTTAEPDSDPSGGWRIPLHIQILAAALIGVGCFICLGH